MKIKISMKGNRLTYGSLFKVSKMNKNYEQKITALENQVKDLQEQLSKLNTDKIIEITMNSIRDIFLKVSMQNR